MVRWISGLNLQSSASIPPEASTLWNSSPLNSNDGILYRDHNFKINSTLFPQCSHRQRSKSAVPRRSFSENVSLSCIQSHSSEQTSISLLSVSMCQLEEEFKPQQKLPCDSKPNQRDHGTRRKRNPSANKISTNRSSVQQVVIQPLSSSMKKILAEEKLQAVTCELSRHTGDGDAVHQVRDQFTDQRHDTFHHSSLDYSRLHAHIYPQEIRFLPQLSRMVLRPEYTTRLLYPQALPLDRRYVASMSYVYPLNEKVKMDRIEGWLSSIHIEDEEDILIQSCDES